MRSVTIITVIVLFSVIPLSPAVAGEVSDFITEMKSEQAKEMEKFDLVEIWLELAKSIVEFGELTLIVAGQEKED